MVTGKRNVLNLASFGKVLKTDIVLVVEIGGVQWEDISVSVKLLEPGGLLWIDHGVVLEHDKHGSVQTGESLFSDVSELSSRDLLVVHRWQEDAVLLISLHVVDISEISSWCEPVLGKAEVDNSLGQEVDDIASESREAAWNGINSHVWSTGSKHISNFTWHITLLSDVSGKKAALRKSNGVELSLEIFVGSNLLAGLLGDGLEVVEDLSDEWKANFDAVNWSFSCSSNLFIELKVSWVDASISESMEHSSWYTLIGVISGNFFSDNGVIISVGGIKWRIMMFLVSRVGFELCTPLFLGIFDQGALFVDIFWCRIG